MISKWNKPLRRHLYVSKKFSRRKKITTQTDDHGHWLDIWLPRISHFSQFGLFVITLGSLYFVVLPIYQKSMLDEAIARKEIELKKSEKLVEESYGQLRKFAVANFTRGAFVKCVFNSQNVEHTNGKNIEGQDLSNDASNCLLELGKTSPNIKLLRPDDQAFFFTELKNVVAEIEQNRAIVLKKYVELPDKAKSEPLLLKPPKYFSVELNKIFEKLMYSESESRMAKLRFNAGVASAQLDLYSEHLDFAKQKLVSMANLNWSNSKYTILN